MVVEPGSGERVPPSSADVLAWQQREADRRAGKLKRNPIPRIDEHVDLEQADSEARERRRSHPTYGSTRKLPLPVGSSPVVGEGSRGKDPGK